DVGVRQEETIGISAPLVGEAECAAGDLSAVEIHAHRWALPRLRRLLRCLLDPLLVAGSDLHVLDHGLRHAELPDDEPGLLWIAGQLSLRTERAGRNGHPPGTSQLIEARQLDSLEIEREITERARRRPEIGASTAPKRSGAQERRVQLDAGGRPGFLTRRDFDRRES